MNFQVKTTKASKDTTFLHASGQLVVGEATTKLQEYVTRQRDNRLVIDLARVSAIDGAGLGSLVWLRNWAISSGRKLSFADPSDRVRELLELTRLDSVLDICTCQPQTITNFADRGVAPKLCGATL